ncbi:MAG: isocitrate/isopropylmalate dehydrogenase family protein [Kiloniellales bacterium]|nr:isocitrate/isopropylmalate dehydrogenase family protein [Kiloniellales bacterium]
MAESSRFRIAVMPGDGIGIEIMPPCLEILRRVQDRVGGFGLDFEVLPAGAGHYRETGTALPEDSLRRAGEADAILLGAMGLPSVRYPDGREIAPQLDLRETFELFAGLRPVRSLPGVPGPLADPRARELDFVLVRESTEGLFAARGKTVLDGDETARDTMVITRKACERLFQAAFDLARRRRAKGRPGRVTCVDKANVLGSFAFFRKIFDECAARNPEVEAAHGYVDAMALTLIRNPWDLDVLVTENLFGDILSDAGAALMGGMGMAPSADVGDSRAVFQPCHGTAPDIVGTGKANPTAMYLSAAMMLDWLGEQHGLPSCVEAGDLLVGAVEQAFAEGGLRPNELGGSSGLREITEGVLAALDGAAA